MTVSYVLDFDQLFRQRIKSCELLPAVNDPYYDRLVKAYGEFLDRRPSWKNRDQKIIWRWITWPCSAIS